MQLHSAIINTKYLLSETQGSGHTLPQQGIELRIGRLYKFDLSDSSNNNYPLKFSADDPEGPNADPSPGTEYTAGVSKVGHCRHIRSIYVSSSRCIYRN